MFLNASTEAALPRPEVQITPKAEEAARLGVTVQQIASVVRVATIGDVSAALGKLSIDNRLVPIPRPAGRGIARQSGPHLGAEDHDVLWSGAPVRRGHRRGRRRPVAGQAADPAAGGDRRGRHCPGFVLDLATARFQEILRR